MLGERSSEKSRVDVCIPVNQGLHRSSQGLVTNYAGESPCVGLDKSEGDKNMAPSIPRDGF